MSEIEFINHLKKIDINITETQLNQLEKYYEMLFEYNKKINITSIIKKEDVYLKHFYDSLTLAKAIDLDEYINICDIGSGAGFPGLVLKIVFPKIKITLIDSIMKKTNFLKLVVKELKLLNVEIITERVEVFSKTNREKYDLVTCRAVSKLNIISELCIPITKVNGYFIPMKSDIDKELLNLNFLKKLDSVIEKTYDFALPIEISKRTLIKIKKTKKTNSIYPRSYKTIKETPL